MTESTQLAVAPAEELELVIKEQLLPAVKAETILKVFAPYATKAKEWVERAQAINVTDASQVGDQKMARVIRLELKNIRVSAEKKRKELKEDINREGKAIDGLNNWLLLLIEPAEQKMQEAEDFAARAEETRIAKIKADRILMLQPYGVDTTAYNLDVMTDDTFTALLDNTKALHEAKLEAARKAEADRIAKVEADRLERIRIQEENERLRKEAEEKEAALKAEREAAEIERKRVEDLARKEREAIEAAAALERQEAARAAKEAADKAAAEKAEIEAKAKAEREALEAKQREEHAKVQAEVAKMKEAHAVRAKKDKEEQDKRQAEIAAELKKANDAKAQAEAELAAAKQAEADKIAAEAEAARKAAAAPDKEKLVAFAKSLFHIETPTLTTDSGKAAMVAISTQIDKLAFYIQGKAEAL